jgi:RNA polymerase primary sigma factor
MKELKVLNEKLMANFESINFNRKTINRIVIKFKNLVNRMNTYVAESKTALREPSLKMFHFVERLKVVESSMKKN